MVSKVISSDIITVPISIASTRTTITASILLWIPFVGPYMIPTSKAEWVYVRDLTLSATIQYLIASTVWNPFPPTMVADASYRSITGSSVKALVAAVSILILLDAPHVR